MSELGPDEQAMLLRAVEEKRFLPVGADAEARSSFQLIARTNRDPAVAVRTGRFREDLYYRLTVVRVRLPALRERPEDIPHLVRRFLAAFAAGDAVVARLTSVEHLSALTRSAWPGNVRELKNAIERSVLLDQVSLPAEPGTPAHGRTAVNIALPYEEARRRALTEFERCYLGAQLAAHGDNVSSAARASGMGRVNFHRLLRRIGLR